MSVLVAMVIPLSLSLCSPAANKNTLEMVQYGVEGSSTFLECQARSPHALLKWHLQRDNSDRRKEVTHRVSVQKRHNINFFFSSSFFSGHFHIGRGPVITFQVRWRFKCSMTHLRNDPCSVILFSDSPALIGRRLISHTGPKGMTHKDRGAEEKRTESPLLSYIHP